MSSKVEQLHQQLKERILVLDGGMGTMIQGYRLSEQDFRGERFADWPCDLKGNNDLLVLSKPEVIREIHDAYFEENQLSPGSIGISPLSTPHHHPFQRMCVRTSIAFYGNFILDMDRSPGFGYMTGD